MDNYVGKRLDGRYELLEIIGVGGMAVVYKAYDNVEARTVAVKILKEEFISNEEFIRRFKNESKAIAVLSHPNIVKVFDVSFGEKLQYIVMEYIDGITLKQLIEQQGTLRWKDALYYTVQILRALQHAHDSGIVHRDIKPQNIMVLVDGTIKVTDFGIARFARSEQKTLTDKAIGSVHYISPEQARGDNTDEKSDIYSVGVMLYEMLTGQLPFQADSAVSVAIMQLQREPDLPTAINGSIPAGLEQITMHAMQKTPSSRYHSASEMLCDLETFKRDPSAVFDYGYFVDDDPTRYVADVNETHVEKKIPWLPIISGITVTFVATLVILLAMYIPRMVGRTPDEPCPKFIGMKWEDVQKGEYYEDFELIAKFESSDQEKGVIIAQSVPEDYKVKKGQSITLTISSGAKTVMVPDVYGKNQEVATSLLKEDGFLTEFVTVADNDVAEGMVIRTSPDIGTSIPEGSTVTVYISSGKATVMVSLPDCVGLSRSDAIKLLESKGLVVGNVTEVNNTNKAYAAGTVLAQSPTYSPGQQIGKGSAVDITLSTGNFEVSVDFAIPQDYVSDKGYLSLWYGDECISISKLVDFRSNTTYKMAFTTDREIINNCIIKISGEDKIFENYQEISINCANGTSTYHRTFAYTTKSAES